MASWSGHIVKGFAEFGLDPLSLREAEVPLEPLPRESDSMQRVDDARRNVQSL